MPSKFRTDSILTQSTLFHIATHNEQVRYVDYFAYFIIN